MRPSHGTAFVLVVALIVAGCAGRRPHELGEARGGTQLVATDEPLERVTGSQLPPQPADTTVTDPLLAAMTRMVANDGAWRPLVWRGVSRVVETRCRGSAPGDPLAAPDPRGVLAQKPWTTRWVHVGLSLDSGSGWAGPQVAPCRDTGATTALASRGGLLAPAVTGRDTSVLFTTRRGHVPAPAGAGVVEAVIERVVTPRGADGEGRKAMPRIRLRG